MTRHTVPLLAVGLLFPSLIASAYTFNDTFDTCIWNAAGPLDSHHPTTYSTLYHFDEEPAIRLNTSHPWSLPPPCVNAANNPMAQYCVFTTHNFKATHSMSVITTPKIASLIHSANAIHDPVYEWEAGNAMTPANVPRRLLPAHVRILDEEDRTFEVRAVPGKGKGVIARREIRKGEVIMIGYPTIVGRMRFSKAVSAEQARKLIKYAVERLPTDAREEVMELAKSTGGEAAVEDVLRTNI